MAQLAAIFDSDPAVLAAHALARQRFEEWAANGADDPPPPNATDALQIQLMRWERRMFGNVPSVMHALGVIEEMTETFLADMPNSAEGALDGLGDTCVYAAQLCTGNRLALGPVLDLARVFTSRSGLKLLTAPGVLAQVVLKGAQKIRGLDDENRFRTRLVGALAMCIAKAIDDVEVMHDVRVRVAEVFGVVAGEVLARGAGHDGIPKSVKPEVTEVTVTAEEIEAHKKARDDKALSRMKDAIDILDPSAEP